MGGGGGGGGGWGGAIFIRAGTLNLEDCVFSNNSAYPGTGGTTFGQPDFLGANGQGKGGAIYIYDGATVNATRVNFSGSSAQDGLGTDTDNQDWYGTLTIIDTTILGIRKTTSSTQVKPGDIVTFTLTHRNRGEVAATNVSLADIIPSVISVTQIVDSGIRITNTGITPSYVWQIADVVSPTIGVITVTGILTAPLARGLVITNSATITGYLEAYTSSTSYITLKVQNVAPVPVAATRSISENVAIGTLVGDPITATDSNGDGITFGISGGNPGEAFSINAATGQFIVNNALDFETQALYVLTVQVSDGLLISSSPVTVSVTDINEPPFFTSLPVLTATEDSTYTYHLVATDQDAGSILTITAISKPSWLTATLSGNMSGTVTGTLYATPRKTEVGIYSVILQVEDQTGLTGTQSYSLTVYYINHPPSFTNTLVTTATQVFTIVVVNINDPPSFTSTPVTSATQDMVYTYVISTTDLDLNYGDMLTISALIKPSWLTFAPTSHCSATLSGIPRNENVGYNNHVRLQVVDSGGLTTTQDFTITVANVNDAPSFTSSPVTTATQDVAYTYVISTTDPDLNYGDALTITTVTKPAWLTFTTTTHFSATLGGIPDNSDVGNDLVTLQVIDKGGLTATQTFTIVVANVNDPPAFTSTPDIVGLQDIPYTYTIRVDDPDLGWGDVLTISVISEPGWLNFSQSGAVTGSLTGTPTSAVLGEHVVELMVTDSAALTATQRFTLTVYDQIYNLTINIIGEGNVAVSPAKPFYILGDTLTLTVTMGWSWGFDGWSGDISGSEKTWNNVINSNMNITATFTSKQIFLPRVSK